MTTSPTIRAYGGQSLTAPLRDVLLKRPGAAFGKAFEDPAHGFLHPVDLDLAQREHDAFVDLLASMGPTVHTLDAEIGDPDLTYTYDPLIVTDRGAIPLRTGKASPPRSRPGRLRPASRPSAGSRHPAPSRVGTPSGSGPICSVSAGRCGRTTRACDSWRPWSAATFASSTCRTGAARPS